MEHTFISWTEFMAQHFPGKHKPGQYLLGAYDTVESWNRSVVVVSEKASRPLFVRKPRARRNSTRAAVVLVVPSLDHLNADLAGAHTNVLAPYFGVRDLFTDELITTIHRDTTRRSSMEAAA